MIDEGNGRAPYFLLPSPSLPLAVSCFFAATLLPEVAFARRARPEETFVSRATQGFADIGFSNVIYPSSEQLPAIPPCTPRSLHQAAPLVHNKGSTPREASTDSTEFQCSLLSALSCLYLLNLEKCRAQTARTIVLL